jgi:cell division protein FtsQ
MAIAQQASHSHWGWGARALLLVVMVAALLLLWQALQPWLQRPLQQIVLQANIPVAQRLLVQAQLDEHISDSFFGANLNQIKAEVEANPWVHNAKVSRIWPNGLMVEAEKQIMMARWSDGGFLNHQGDLVSVDSQYIVAAEQLPALSGPSTSAWTMSQLFRQMSWLVGRENLRIVEFKQARRGAIQLQLDNGIVLVLGRQEIIPRLQRLMKIYHTQLTAIAGSVERIDGRYPHGISVAWRVAD